MCPDIENSFKVGNVAYVRDVCQCRLHIHAFSIIFCQVKYY